jgi:hypothetical protein
MCKILEVLEICKCVAMCVLVCVCCNLLMVCVRMLMICNIYMTHMGIPIQFPYCNDFAHAQIHCIIEQLMIAMLPSEAN